MEIGQLEAFERAAREGSFTRAAEALSLTQPAVSTRVALLEAELGGALFERQGRQLALTRLGEFFLPYARRMLASMEDGREAVQNFREGRAGQIRIAAPAPFVLSFLMDTLEHFRQQHPTIDILIRERSKATILEMLHDNTMTLGLVNVPIFDRSITRLATFRDPILPVIAPSHTLADIGAINMEAIYEHTIFRVSMSPQMTAFMDEVVEHGRHGSGGAVIAVPMIMALRLVIRGQGVTFLPASYVKRHVDEGRLQILDIQDMSALISEPVLVTYKSRQLDPIHQEFIRIFKATWRHLLISGK